MRWVVLAAFLVLPGIAHAQQQPTEVQYTEPNTSFENDLDLIRLFIVSKATGLSVHTQDYSVLDGDLDGTVGTPAGGIDRRQRVTAPTLGPGDYDFHVVAVDLGGNASLPSNMLTFTVAPPPPPPDTAPEPPVLKDIAQSLERMATALEQIASTRVVVMTDGN